MTRYLFPLIALFVTILLPSCHNKNDKKAGTNISASIFSTSNNDTALFAKHTNDLPQTLLADSAYKLSGLVMICTILALDSTVHQNEKAPFYLVRVRTDTLLKGNAKRGDQLYFISKYLPDLKPGQGNRILYLCKRKTARLLAYNHIGWQWVDNAPFTGYDKTKIFVQAVPKEVKRLKRRWWSRLHP